MKEQHFDPDDVAGMVVFASVAERGSFTAAAADLGLAKSVVSAKVARLEQRLGVRLLHRTSRRVALTPAGTEVYPSCARVARAAAEAREVAAAEADAPHGRLRVNGPVSFGQRWLAAPLARFAERHPAVHLEVILQDDVVDVVGGGWDVVLRFGAVRDPELVARRFARDVGVCCASPDYLARHGAPKHPIELADHACLRYANVSRDQEWRFQTPDGALSVPIAGPMTTNDGTLLTALAEAGAGLIVSPWFIVGESVRAGRLVRVLPTFGLNELPAQAVHAHGHRPPAKVKAFVDHLVDYFREPPWGLPA
ncbi:MAG: LysR family transcriptional regulator [Pseudomonadota bacterium]|nr:LysR family transcriptional regulator [Pseudomonadota bacterium]